MKIEDEKLYRARNGQMVRVYRASVPVMNEKRIHGAIRYEGDYRFDYSWDLMAWRQNGRYLIGYDSEYDIVELWPGEKADVEV